MQRVTLRKTSTVLVFDSWSLDFLSSYRDLLLCASTGPRSKDFHLNFFCLIFFHIPSCTMKSTITTKWGQLSSFLSSSHFARLLFFCNYLAFDVGSQCWHRREWKLQTTSGWVMRAFTSNKLKFFRSNVDPFLPIMLTGTADASYGITEKVRTTTPGPDCLNLLVFYQLEFTKIKKNELICFNSLLLSVIPLLFYLTFQLNTLRLIM